MFIRLTIDVYAARIAFINALVSGISERNPKATQRSLNIFGKYVVQEGLFVWSIPRKGWDEVNLFKQELKIGSK